MRRLLATLPLALMAGASAAQEMADTLCPILAGVAAEFGTAIPEAAQAQLVTRVASASTTTPTRWTPFSTVPTKSPPPPALPTARPSWATENNLTEAMR